MGRCEHSQPCGGRCAQRKRGQNSWGDQRSGETVEKAGSNSDSNTALVSPSASRSRIQSKKLWASFYCELSYQ
jgi:hypothetical protein